MTTTRAARILAERVNAAGQSPRPVTSYDVLMAQIYLDAIAALIDNLDSSFGIDFNVDRLRTIFVA